MPKLIFKIVPTAAGFTEQFVKPVYNDFQLRLKNNKSKGEFEVSNDITLLGSDYTFFINNVIGESFEIRCYNQDGEMFVSDEKGTEITNNNVSKKQVHLKLSAITEYFSDEFTNYDTRYNITEVVPVAYDLKIPVGQVERLVEADFGTITESTGAISAGWQKSGWTIEYIDNLVIIDLFPYPDTSNYTGDSHYIRQVAYGYYIDGVKYPPPYEGTWTYIEDEVIAGVTYPKYRVTYDPDNFVLTPAVHPFTLVTNNISFYYDGTVDFSNVTRRVEDVIEFLFTQMGVTVSFDNTGTSTDSFYSFKTFTGDSLTFESVSSNKTFGYQLIANLTDMIPTDLGIQKNNIAVRSMISLETLMKRYESYGFEWYLENRSGTYYFRLIHVLHKSLLSGNPDLSNYNGFNYTYLGDVYEVEPPEYKKIENNTTCNGVEFKGTYAEFTETYGEDNTISFDDGNIFVDVDDIMNRRSEAYSEVQDFNFVLVAAQHGSTYDHVRNPEGELTGLEKNNSELAFSYLMPNYISFLPGNVFEVNGTTITLSTSSERLKKRNKYKFTIPIYNIKTDFDPAKYIPIFGKQSELDSMTQNGNSFLGDIIVKTT
jgi:hypothetical protein